MRNLRRFVTICILSAMFLFVAVQTLLAAERIIRMVVPGCE